MWVSCRGSCCSKPPDVQHVQREPRPRVSPAQHTLQWFSGDVAALCRDWRELFWRCALRHGIHSASPVCRAWQVLAQVNQTDVCSASRRSHCARVFIVPVRKNGKAEHGVGHSATICRMTVQIGTGPGRRHIITGPCVKVVCLRVQSFARHETLHVSLWSYTYTEMMSADLRSYLQRFSDLKTTSGLERSGQ